MKGTDLDSLAIVAFVVALFIAMAAPAQTMISGVASVIDGDTIEIHGQRIRLHGIDAAESGQLCTAADGRSWRCGAAAANALDKMIGRRLVNCLQEDMDRYSRVVATCDVGGESLNDWMVETGWAVAYRRYSSEYDDAEDRAREARLGIWGGEFEMPWEWRNRSR